MSTQSDPLPAPLADATRDDAALRRFLRGLPGVDAVGLESRAATLATRSVRQGSRLQAIDTAIRAVDLTTLEGTDTPGRVRSLAATARDPDPERSDVPAVAAVCVHPDMVAAAAEALAGSSVAVASVATAFPAGRSSQQVKLAEVALAVSSGASEVDMVLDRGAFLTGRYGEVYEEISLVKQACRDRHLKVILEAGELGSYDDVRRASWLAMLAGADFLKTSTGKVSPAATLPVTHLMLQAVRDWHQQTGARCGVKPAGGIRSTDDAIRYLVAVKEVAGPEWLTPQRFRLGASSLLDDLLSQRRTQLGSRHGGPDRPARV